MDPELEKLVLRYKFIYSMTGLGLGLVSMIGGIALFLNGIAGSTSWTAKILGNESTITDAAPGAILFIVGLFTVVTTRYKVKIDRGSNQYGNYTQLDTSRDPGPTSQADGSAG
ncbi:hypothetical protein [Larkinella terrae]|uniref:Uncharacterized protein n=1 Tax=Larkinella terrae TaxID=2025311 RepID=A0A7K0EMZ5_9BACT|nr:hypothetical protein [Larkinella terrae]MRS63102.1 hypothetical protein [Larkinella terrae]